MPAQATAQRLTVVSSAESEPYRLALEGMSRLGVAVDHVRAGPGQDQAIAAALARGNRETAVVTLGGAAAAAVGNTRSASAGGVVVNCMVLGTKPERAGTAVNVPLEVPPDVEATWIRRLLPQAHAVGILYDPAQSEARAAASAAAMTRAGFTAITEAVPDPTALPAALQRLQNHVDVLHGLPDTMVYAREHARALLLFSFRHRIPLVGPTEAWVKAGALFAVDWDYVDLGRYCGVLALRQLAGSKVAPSPPRTRVSVNMRTAEQFHLQWSTEQLQYVDKVYP